MMTIMSSLSCSPVNAMDGKSENELETEWTNAVVDMTSVSANPNQELTVSSGFPTTRCNKSMTRRLVGSSTMYRKLSKQGSDNKAIRYKAWHRTHGRGDAVKRNAPLRKCTVRQCFDFISLASQASINRHTMRCDWPLEMRVSDGTTHCGTVPKRSTRRDKHHHPDVP
jgi:hypothetical protein